jgi:membrane-bound lytic murein transglycosylase F
VVVRPAPGLWQNAPDGRPEGLERDLLQHFVDETKRRLLVVPVPSTSDVAGELQAGSGQVGAGGLYRSSRVPAPGRGDPAPHWTVGFLEVEPVVIVNRDSFPLRSWTDLAGASLAYLPGTGIDSGLAAMKAAHPDVRFTPAAMPTADALIAAVDAGRIDYALVSSLQVAHVRNLYLNFDVAFAAGPRLELAWLVRPEADALRQELDAFLARARKSGLVARIADRYVGHAKGVQRIDAGVFQERIRTVLPEFRRLFQEAQEATGVEWRLLAALAYQESQWDPFATSETGVRGLMQLTEETARHLGVADRLDPRGSVHGAARYLRTLKDKLPARIAEPDRTWFALAAFNIGLGHLEDARVLAQRLRLNPDVWLDVRQALPLLALPEYFEHARLGYARGGMPVAFVDRVRSYYDILLRQQPAHQPRLRLAAGP